MAQQTINIGAAGNDGNGDPLRTGAQKINDNFTDLYANKISTSVLDTDGTLAANSDARIATQKAVKTYADALIAANDAMVFKGVINCSANPDYPAADRGHTYKVSGTGKIGGASGTKVELGDMLLCLTDGTASGTQAGVGAQWNILQANIDGAVVGPAGVTDDLPAIFDGTTGTLIKSKTYAAFKTLLALAKVDVGLGSVPNTDCTTQANVSFTGLSAAAAVGDADAFPANQGAGNLKQTFAAVKTWIKSWIAKADVGLGSVDNTSDAAKNSAAATLSNKTLASPIFTGTIDPSGPFGSWTSYTPTVTAGSGSITSKSAIGRYKINGKTMDYHVEVTITTNGPGAGWVEATLPATTAAFNMISPARNNTAGVALVGVAIASSTALRIYKTDGTYPGADGTTLGCTGRCELA